MTFEDLAALGYNRLVPIIPPDAPISARSTLASRVGTRQDGRGKTPGIKGRDGSWSGFDWVKYAADADDLKRWQGMGAGIGIRTGPIDTAPGFTLIAIDADTTREDEARIARDIIQKRLGAMPIRVGRYPKALYLCLVDGDYQYTRIEFGARDANGNTDRVEALAEGRQFVGFGVHPGTGQPYTWPSPILSIDQLPRFKPEQIDDLLLALAAALPEAEPKLIREGASTDINQDTLRGDVETVRRAVAATHNTNQHFPSRESYRNFGYAIKAALPDNEAAAFEIFADWCDRWQDEHGRHNDPDVYASDWRRMKPPYRVGASYIYEKAEAASYGQFSRADAWFAPVDQNDVNAALTIFDVMAKQDRAAETADAPRTLLPLLSIDDIISRPPPRWLIEDMVPQVGLGFLYSRPGEGKSFLIQDMCLTIAAGLGAWHGNTIDCDSDKPIVYIAAEGESGLRNRIKAWLQEHPEADRAAIARRLRIIPKTVDFMKVDDIKILLASIEAADCGKPALIVVDTVSRAMPGADENLQKEMTIFVAACDHIKEHYGCTVMGIHHAGKSGDIRGSTVLSGAGDFVMHLSKKDKASSVVTLTCEKSKDGADTWSASFRLAKTILIGDMRANGTPETSLVVQPLGAAVAAHSVGGECAAGNGELGLAPGLLDAILDAIEAAWNSGDPWAGYRGRVPEDRKGVNRLIRDFKMERDFAVSFLDGLVEGGVLATARTPVDKTVGRNREDRKKGYKVLRRDVGGGICMSGSTAISMSGSDDIFG